VSHDSNIERSRVTLLTGGLAWPLSVTSGRRSGASSPPFPGVTVYNVRRSWPAESSRGTCLPNLIVRLREWPAVAGLGVPGMPVGSPGMEVPGGPPDRYQVFAFDRSGKTTVFASR
jgi:Protein of unknown function, DUF